MGRLPKVAGNKFIIAETRQNGNKEAVETRRFFPKETILPTVEFIFLKINIMETL